MQVKPIKTRVFKERENLASFIREHIPTLKDGSVLAVTSKIVGLAEGRTEVVGKRPKEVLIKEESEYAVETKHTWLTLRDGMFVASSGIDESNGNGKYIFLPKDSYRSATRLRTTLKEAYGIENLGVIITDSRTLPLRRGAFGMSLGYAGIKGLHDYRGTPDIFKRPFTMSRANIADALAAAAVLVMGEGDERHPLAVVTGAPVSYTERVDRHELLIPLVEDMWRPLFGNLKIRPKRGK